MKKNFYYIALAALLLPLLVRGLWFYRGFSTRTTIATPDYMSLSAPEAPENSSDGEVSEAKQYNGTVLIDVAHGNQFTMTEIESLTEAISVRGGKVETAFDSYSLANQLKYASAYVMISPSYEPAADEIRALTDFANRGGRLLVFTDATSYFLYYDSNSGNPIVYGDVNAVNPLLASFGISVNDDYLYNIQEHEGNFRNVFFEDFGKSELTFGIKQVALYGTHSVKAPSGLLLLQGAESTLSSITDANDPGQGGAALSANGNVAVFGDFTFLSSPYNNYADNASLIANIADFTLSGTRNVTIANNPYLFNGKTVQVYLNSDLPKNAEMVTVLGGIQNVMKFLGMDIELTDDYPKSGDALILSTFEPDDDVQALIKKFDLEFNGGTVNIPGFGDVGQSGNTFIVLNTTDKGNQVGLFAEDLNGITFLLSIIQSGDLSSCLTQDYVAVCSTGYSETDLSSGFDFGFGDETTTEVPVEGEATSTPTPEAPSG